MSIIFSGKSGRVHCWCMYEHGPSPVPRAGSRAGLGCKDGLANMTGSFFPHSSQPICNVTLTLLHFLQLCQPCCCCSHSHGACPQHFAPAGMQSSRPQPQPGLGAPKGRASSQAWLGDAAAAALGWEQHKCWI